MESGKRNRKSQESLWLRLGLYALLFALILVHPVVEMKTGIPIGRRFAARFHDPLSWNEVWAHLPGMLLLCLAITAPICALIEWAVRRKMKGDSSILDSESETSDSPAKPLTGLWRIATIVYFAAMVLALYVYSSGDWGWAMPRLLPLAGFAPIFVSLGFLAIYTGEFQVRRGVFYRSKNPIWYWVCVATILAVGIGLFLAGIGSSRQGGGATPNVAGGRATRPVIERAEVLSERLTFVEVRWLAFEVRWLAFDVAGQERSSERSCYILRLADDGEPRIRLALTRTVTE